MKWWMKMSMTSQVRKQITEYLLSDPDGKLPTYFPKSVTLDEIESAVFRDTTSSRLTDVGNSIMKDHFVSYNAPMSLKDKEVPIFISGRQLGNLAKTLDMPFHLNWKQDIITLYSEVDFFSLQLYDDFSSWLTNLGA